MPDQHHSANAAAQGSRAPRAVIAFLLVGATIAGAILALRAVADSESCSGALVLAVEAAPEMAAPIQSASAEYQKTGPSVDGTCVSIQVHARAAHETTQLLGAGWKDATARALDH